DDFIPEDNLPSEALTRDAAVAAALHIHNQKPLQNQSESGATNPWREAAWREQNNIRL
ncbi:MAG: hypothetical protein HQ574_03560, partial [Chloroflexi bacterium]|nr:hypothetical protein [Chloroflexota bacterium]